MGKLQIILLLSVVTCAYISTVQSVPVSEESVQSEKAAKCKKLCGFCGCTGYYCGDECLCECNSVTDGEAQCVDKMKSNCKKMKLPFEVLIQGPNVNRMVRSLLYANPDEEVCVKSSELNKDRRSTISIYKPKKIHQKNEILAAPRVDTQETDKDDSPISVIVAQKSDKGIQETESIVQDTKYPEMVDNVENLSPDAESYQQSDSLTMDDADRTNTKRHIVDVNQDITEFTNSHFDDSFLYKRDAAEETVAATQDETVAAPQDETVAAHQDEKIALPAKSGFSSPFNPNFRKPFDKIPSAAEIRDAWENVRDKMNSNINRAIDAAQNKAVELRSKTNPSIKTSVPALPSHTKYNPWMTPAVPLVPNGKNFRANNWNNNGWNNNGWNNNGWNNYNWLLGAPFDENVAAVAEDPAVGAAAPAEATEEPSS